MKKDIAEILATSQDGDNIFSVSVFLELINVGLRTFDVKIRGEVTSVDARGNVYYFNLKDKDDGSVVSCLIWKNNYRLSGLDLKVGMEIIAHGFPNVYKPSGRLSFQADTLELFGLGGLKQQFEELKNRLTKEGLLEEKRKKNIPPFPHKIGLITSRQGEAIFDFKANLGKFGFQIQFVDSRVEGIQAVSDLIKAVRYFRNKDIDVLVLIRGGGSLESLLSFNNEALVREIARFPKPVMSGIGHEQDVSLVDLVADKSCSTPTSVARVLSAGWEQALSQVNLFERDIFHLYCNSLIEKKYSVENNARHLREKFLEIINHFKQLEAKFHRGLFVLRSSVRQSREYSLSLVRRLFLQFKRIWQDATTSVTIAESVVSSGNPLRQLALGYSIIRSKGKIIRSVLSVGKGEEIKVELVDGEIISTVNKINPNHGQ